MTITPTERTYKEDDLLTTRQAGDLFGTSEPTMNRWRAEGKGPPFIRIGRKVRYRFGSATAWLLKQEIDPAREARSPTPSSIVRRRKPHH